MKDFVVGIILCFFLWLFIVACGGVECSTTCGEIYSNVLVGAVAITGILVLEIITGVI